MNYANMQTDNNVDHTPNVVQLLYAFISLVNKNSQ